MFVQIFVWRECKAKNMVGIWNGTRECNTNTANKSKSMENTNKTTTSDQFHSHFWFRYGIFIRSRRPRIVEASILPNRHPPSHSLPPIPLNCLQYLHCLHTHKHTFAIATHNQLNEENNIERPIPTKLQQMHRIYNKYYPENSLK